MRASRPSSIAPRGLLTGLLGLALLCSGAAARVEDAPPSDAELRKRWQALSADERAELAEAYLAEVRWLDTYQLRFQRFVLRASEDPGSLPDADPTPVFDPAVHAPAQPIPRKRLAADSAKVRAQRKAFFKKFADRTPLPAYAYDYGLRRVERCRDPNEPEPLFENALVGAPPDTDLVEALIERALDDGAQQAALAAFDHAYTDREGNVYEGLTLYDAWASGSDMEMPDVDALGVLHTVLDDWKRYKAPVPERKQDALYETIGELFTPAQRQRGLRHALARTFSRGTLELRDGYALHLDRLHALWEAHTSTPEELVKVLPTAKQWEDFLADWVTKTAKKPDLLQAGLVRRGALDAGAAELRQAFVRALQEIEAARSSAAAVGADPAAEAEEERAGKRGKQGKEPPRR